MRLCMSKYLFTRTDLDISPPVKLYIHHLICNTSKKLDMWPQHPGSKPVPRRSVFFLLIVHVIYTKTDSSND